MAKTVPDGPYFRAIPIGSYAEVPEAAPNATLIQAPHSALADQISKFSGGILLSCIILRAMIKIIAYIATTIAFASGLGLETAQKAPEVAFTLPRPRAELAFTLPRPRAEVAFTLPRPRAELAFTLPRPRAEVAFTLPRPRAKMA